MYLIYHDSYAVDYLDGLISSQRVSTNPIFACVNCNSEKTALDLFANKYFKLGYESMNMEFIKNMLDALWIYACVSKADNETYTKEIKEYLLTKRNIKPLTVEGIEIIDKYSYIFSEECLDDVIKHPRINYKQLFEKIEKIVGNEILFITWRWFFIDLRFDLKEVPMV